ncbi:MAG: DUF1559 domain-containing protein [Planctomycetota bacterium]|nr:DUF1559 domain-containing protein [Planctomycetota bacterium]
MSLENEQPTKTGSRSHYQWWAGGSFACLLLAGLVYQALQQRSIPLKPSEETTLITGPLDADGQLDFLQAFEEQAYSKRIATADNGMRLLVQRIQCPENRSNDMEDLCRKLGLDPRQLSPDLKYEDPYTFCRKTNFELKDEFFRQIELEEGEFASTDVATKTYQDYDRSEIINGRGSRPWTLGELPMLKQWLDDNGPVLDLIAEAVRKPVFEIPLARADRDTLLLELFMIGPEFRSYARGYELRANYFLGTGNYEAAHRDILSCKRLGRHLQNGTTLVDRLCGIAIEGMADSLGICSHTGPRPTREQLSNFLDQLDQLPPVHPKSKSFYFERLVATELVYRYSGALDLSDALPGGKELQSFLGQGLDWNRVFREFQRQYESLTRANSQLPHPSKLGGTMNWQDRLSRRSRSEKLGRLLAGLLTPATSAYGEAENRARCAENLRRLSIAMLLYEADQGNLPPVWTADSNGKPLHSWRVLLLPYLGQQKLYDQIRLDEPWNSKHNQKFSSADVPCFRCPSCIACTTGQTTYSVIVGGETAFPEGLGRPLSELPPRAQRMILIAERKDPVNWLEPGNELLQSDVEKGVGSASATGGVATISSDHFGGSQVGNRDGSTDFLSETMELPMLKARLRGTYSGFKN